MRDGRACCGSLPYSAAKHLWKEDNMTRLVALFLIAGTALLAGCNTVAGAGEDISKGGQAIHNTAEQAK